MATKPIEQPLIVIVGPTASGKTTLAIEVAKQFSGEIICADSRTVYKGMDIGTAKPTKAQQSEVPHFGLDLVGPDEPFSVFEFKKYADQKIAEIKKRGHIPILVGGTGLYIDAVLFDYQFGIGIDKKLRSKLQHMSLTELYDYCESHKINLPENYKNKRYVIRTIENSGSNIIRKIEPVYKNIIVGITTDKILLREQIITRIEQLIENGVVEEATKLGKKYGWEIEAMKSNMYPLIHRYIENDITNDDLVAKSVTVDWRLAKRQLTYLRRNKFIHWMTISEANKYLLDQLASTR